MAMNLISLMEIYALANGTEFDGILSDYTLDSRLDRDTMNNSIISELGVYTPIVNQTTSFKMMLDNFFDKYETNITKLVDTIYLEYNPLRNKDLYEKEDKKQDTESTVTANTEGSQEDKVSAYDVSTYQPKDYSETNAESVSDLESGITEDNLVHTYGKDGEESFQDLIEKERKLAEFNIYNWILNKMKAELFLLVI